MFPHFKNLPYEDSFSELGLWSFEERRNRVDLIEVFKMVKQLSSVPWNRLLKRAEDSVTRGHSWKLVKESCRCNYRLHFFSQRVINRWNSLSQDDIDAATVNSFKHLLQRRRKCQMDFFKDWMSASPLAARECWNCWIVRWSGWLYQVQPHPVSNPVSRNRIRGYNYLGIRTWFQLLSK